jgi:vancomycin permeability regulator SanA
MFIFKKTVSGKIPDMLRKILMMIFKVFVLLAITTPIVLFLPRGISAWQTKSMILSPEQVPSERVAIIFGAGLWRDGSPTPVLRDRVAQAANLYFAGKVEKLLMSGDNSFQDYNEPQAMREYAISLGVPDQAIVLDYAGRRTYDTCYRARDIFGIKKAILVTQSFHLPRALYICNSLGIQANGVASDLRNYPRRSLSFWNFREIPATLVAFWEVHVSRPIPVLGNPEPIFPIEAQ